MAGYNGYNGYKLTKINRFDEKNLPIFTDEQVEISTKNNRTIISFHNLYYLFFHSVLPFGATFLVRAYILHILRCSEYLHS